MGAKLAHRRLFGERIEAPPKAIGAQAAGVVGLIAWPRRVASRSRTACNRRHGCTPCDNSDERRSHQPGCVRGARGASLTCAGTFRNAVSPPPRTVPGRPPAGSFRPVSAAIRKSRRISDVNQKTASFTSTRRLCRKAEQEVQPRRSRSRPGRSCGQPKRLAGWARPPQIKRRAHKANPCGKPSRRSQFRGHIKAGFCRHRFVA